MQYAAFLRGINVGGKVLIKMDDLKKLFEKAGFTNVKTILASGNVIFDTEVSPDAAEKKAEELLRAKYKRDIFVLVRSIDDLEKLHKRDPFKGIKVTKNTRLYVTFCREKPKGLKPQKHPGFVILSIKDREIFSVLELPSKSSHAYSPAGELRDPASAPSASGLATGPHPRLTPDVMKIMGKEVGVMTMRNWNTVQKVLIAANP